MLLRQPRRDLRNGAHRHNRLPQQDRLNILRHRRRQLRRDRLNTQRRRPPRLLILFRRLPHKVSRRQFQGDRPHRRLLLRRQHHRTQRRSLQLHKLSPPPCRPGPLRRRQRRAYLQLRHLPRKVSHALFLVSRKRHRLRRKVDRSRRSSFQCKVGLCLLPAQQQTPRQRRSLDPAIRHRPHSKHGRSRQLRPERASPHYRLKASL
jgi:hypothetical protein